MKHPFVDLPQEAYSNYYKNQVGGVVLPYFSGGRQFGGGLSSIVGRMMRGVILPTLGRVATGIKRKGAKRLLNLGQGVLSDAIAGKNIGQSIKTRGISEARGAARDLLSTAARAVGPRQSQPARRRRMTRVRKPRQLALRPRRAPKGRKPRSRDDIFA